MTKTAEVTRVTREKIEVSPCIKCGSTNINFLGEWQSIMVPVKDPKAFCGNCGYTPEVGPRLFKDPYEHYRFWNEMNEPKVWVEMLVSQIKDLRDSAESLDNELVELAARFPEILNEEYSFGRLVSGKEAIENHKK